MKAVLTSLGSVGDIQPMLALGCELQSAGHDVILALSPNYESRAADVGIPFAPMGPLMPQEMVRSVITQQTAMEASSDQARHFLNVVMPYIPEIFTELRAICVGADVLISTPHQIASRMVHDVSGIPFCTIHLAHFGALGSIGLKSATAPVINRHREGLGLPVLDDPLTKDATSPQLALYAVTSRILKRPKNWPPHHYVTGFFYLEEDWTPPDELVRFLLAGPPPVVVSFSSMMYDDSDRVTDILLAALERLACRAVILSGWADLTYDRPLPSTVLCLEGFIPHGWLFPRAEILVHHGGAGTTAAAFRSGVPAVIVPHMLDQPIWAEFARALGCAGPAIPIQKLSAERLADALRATMENTAMKSAAQRLAHDISGENGIVIARKRIEELVEKCARSY